MVSAALLGGPFMAASGAHATDRPFTLGSDLIAAPASRDVVPARVYRVTGNVLYHGAQANLREQGASITYDFGREVGGTVLIESVIPGHQASAVDLSFSESPLFVGHDSDSSAGGRGGHDGSLTVALRDRTAVEMSQSTQRGGFRYLTITLSSPVPIVLTMPHVHITFSPGTELRHYTGGFYASDTLLNKIWYAGAYTVQTNIIGSSAGRQWPFVKSGWNNAATIAAGDSVLVDGAKRDRTVWPGDMGIAVATEFVSTDNLVPVRNALQILFDHQNAKDGSLPECGPPLLKYGSDTYHFWTLIGAERYVLYSGDMVWLRSIWPRYREGVEYAESLRTANGLIDVRGVRDWGRIGQGGDNLEANVLFVEALRSAATLAIWMDEPGLAARYHAEISTVRSAINALLWDDAHGALRDNPTSSLLPQDGNALAVLFDVVTDPERALSILNVLKLRWNRYGAVSAELPSTIAPFIGSFEVMARFHAHDDENGLDLIRREWGYMLDDPDGNHSTLLEGYLADGSLGYRGAYGYEHDPSYVSHSHGWSSGPTSALTFDVLGLRPMEPAGKTWTFEPHPGDLKTVQGGFTTGLGIFQARWLSDGQSHIIAVDLNVPKGSSGVILLPLAEGATVFLDGRPATGMTTHSASRGAIIGTISDITGGHHTVTAR